MRKKCANKKLLIFFFGSEWFLPIKKKRSECDSFNLPLEVSTFRLRCCCWFFFRLLAISLYHINEHSCLTHCICASVKIDSLISSPPLDSPANPFIFAPIGMDGGEIFVRNDQIKPATTQNKCKGRCIHLSIRNDIICIVIRAQRRKDDPFLSLFIYILKILFWPTLSINIISPVQAVCVCNYFQIYCVSILILFVLFTFPSFQSRVLWELSDYYDQ